MDDLSVFQPEDNSLSIFNSPRISHCPQSPSLDDSQELWASTQDQNPISSSVSGDFQPKSSPLYFDNPKHPPILDNGVFFRYEDDPVGYRRLKKKIQNRKSSQKLRSSAKNSMASLADQLERLSADYSRVRNENDCLQKQNQELSKKCEFYHKTLTESLRQAQSVPAETKSEDLEIVFEPKQGLTRANISDNSRSIRFFFVFTVFTIAIQFVDMPVASIQPSGYALKGVEAAVPELARKGPHYDLLGALKGGSIVLWVCLLVFNLKKLID